MIKKLIDPVLSDMEIVPMEIPKIVPVKEEKRIIPDEDIFKAETKDEIESDEDIVKAPIKLEVKPKPRGSKKKGGDGKRGPDKKPRAKPVLSEERREILTRAREASVLKRQALRDEKDRLKATITEQAKKNIAKTVSFKQLQPAPPPTPIKNDQEQFFSLMDEWDNRKQARKVKKKQSEISKKIHSEPNTDSKNQNHPASKSIPANSRPQAPPNPFDELFNYTNKNTFW